MAQQEINVGNSPNDGQGNPIRTAFIKCNDNFNELYARAQPNPPPTLVGVPGDEPGYYAYDSTYFYYCFANFDGVSTIWAQVTQVGNINLPQIINGTSNVSIVDPNGNAVISIAGNSNIATFTTAGLDVTGGVSVTGNITAGTYFIGNGALLTGLAASYSNANVAAFLPTYSGNLAGGNLSVTGNVDGNQLNVANVWANRIDSPTGNTYVTSKLNTLDTVTFSSGVTAQTGLSVVGNISTGNITAAGFSTASFFIGDGGLLSNITASSGTRIENGLSNVSIPVSSGNVEITAGFTPNAMVVSYEGVDVQGRAIITGDITGANVITLGEVSAVGNITGSYIIGNGALLTGITGGGGSGNYSNANVAAFLPTYTGNVGAGNVNVNSAGRVVGNVSGVVTGQLYGLVNGVNPDYGTWDFGYIVANTYSNPIQWIFAQSSLGNIDMGTIPAPAGFDIDIGTIF